MSYIASARETGIYSAAFRIVETFAVVPWLVVSSGFPILARAARDDADRLRYALGRLFDVSLLIGVWISLSVAIGAYVAVEIVAGHAFDGATSVLRIQALSLITAFLVATWSFALLSLKRFRELLIANAIAAVTAAGLTIGLVPSLGAEGAAIATLAAEAVLAGGYLFALSRTNRALMPPFAEVPRLLPGAAAMVGIGLLLPSHPVVAVILAGAAYWALAFLLRAVPPELINAVRRRDPPSA
jgi:O-antigen/teichoic acid export membrane protein